MKSIDLFFAQPWLLLLAVPAAAFVLLAPRLLRREKEKSRTDRAAAILRAVAVALLAVIAAGPGGTRYLTERQTVVLLDQSASMEPVRAQTDAWAEEAKRDEHTTVLPFAALDEAGAIASDGTDIAAAIDEAASRFAGPGGRRIILISDGVQTQGDALTAAETAAQAGVRLDAVQMKPEFPAPQAELAAFELPAEAMEGRHMEAAVTVLADMQGEAALRIWDGETLLHEQRVALTAGRQTFACAIEAGAVGAHTLRAEVALPGDTIAENDSLTATMNVSRGEKVLLVDGTGAQAQQLEQLLCAEGVQVAVTDPKNVPESVDALCEYGLTVLMNVHAGDLPEGWDDVLRQAVENHGRSVLTTGGENTYLYGGMKDSGYEALLPIRMSVEEKESVDPVGLMLVIDTTDSMTRESIGVPIDMARRGAIKCVDALNGNDYAGVITFSDDAQMLVEMTAMGDKKPVLDAINSIETADPNKLTRFTGALRLACDTLKAFDGTKRKHVMFITDGSPADAQAGFEQIAKEMRAASRSPRSSWGGWSTWSTCWKISRISAAAAAIWWKAAGTCRISCRWIRCSRRWNTQSKRRLSPSAARMTRPLPMKRRSCSSLAMCVRRQRATRM